VALSNNARGVVFMNVAMAAFTVNDALMKLATEAVPLMQAICLRGILTASALLVLALATGALRVRPGRLDGRLLALRTLAEVAGTLTFLAALRHMPLANLSAILQSLPLAVTLAAALVLREAVGWRRMLAIAVGFAGVLLIVRPGSAAFDGWSVLGLISVACVVVRDLATRRFTQAVPSVAVALSAAVAVATTGFAGTVISGGFVSMTAEDSLRISAAAVALVFGYLLIVKAMRQGDVAVVAPFRYVALLWAIVLGWLWFGSLPDIATWAGAALIVASGLFTLWREARLRRRPAAATPPA
jgi:drug/metabolite transporter (DMT)-like permease